MINCKDIALTKAFQGVRYDIGDHVQQGLMNLVYNSIETPVTMSGRIRMPPWEEIWDAINIYRGMNETVQ